MQKLHLLAGASVLAVTAIAGVASATTPVTQLYGAGSSLAAPYARQSGDCFGVQQTNAGLTNQFGTDTGYLVQQKNSGGTIITPTIIGVTAFNYTGTPAQNCASKQNTTATEFEYMSTGSGTGIKGVYSHDAQNQWGPVDGSGAVYWPAVYFGMSDNPLGAADVGVYNSGGTEQGISFGPGGAYATPSTLYGPLIQYPFIIDPVVFAYEPTYKRVVAADGSSHTDYHFNNHYPRTDGSGGLHLDSATYCQIFNGQITNWNAAALKTLNGKISLEDPTDPTPPASWSVPLQIVGRNDSSGTTSIFYRHLSTVCTEAGNQFASTTAVPSTLPAALRGPHWLKANAPYGANNGGIVDVPGEFTLADGNDGVAKYLGAFADASTLGSAEGGTNGTLNDGQTIILGRLGYVGPDFALPYVTNTGANSYGLNTASPKNAGGKFIEATPKAATASFANAGYPPQSTSTGAFCTTGTGCNTSKLRANPQDWVQAPSSGVPLANPAGSGSYPIVGTTQILMYQCYASSTVATAFDAKGSKTVPAGFLYWYETSKTVTDSTKGLLAEAGLAPLPKAWATAIEASFLFGTDGLGLNIGQAQGATAPANCKVAGIVGG